MTRWRAVREVVLPPPGAGRIAGSALADAVGTGVFASGAAVYFSERLGLSIAVIAGGLAIAGAVSLAAVTPLGMLSDRFGYQRMVRITHFGRAVLYPLFLFVDNVAGFAAVITLATVLERLASPAFQAMVGAAVGAEGRNETMGYVRAMRNAGFALGGLVTSAAIAVGTATAYDVLPIGNAVSFALAGLLLAGVRNTCAPKGEPGERPRRRVRPRYLALAGLNVVLLMHDTILQLALPLYVLNQTRIAPAVLPAMYVVNTVLVVVLQRRLSRWAATMRGAARAEEVAGVLLAVACACFAAVAVLPPVHGGVALVAGVVALTLGESLQIAGSWELSYEHAPSTERGAHLAVFSIGVGVQHSVGPAIVTLLAAWGAVAWFPFAAAFVVAGTATRRMASEPWPAVNRGLEETGAARSH
ncbi:MFS transporter [Nocardia tenerifensis]|uniref:MFS transporter n=1 Tax=Nocardia tenerifensis TaxID=228006 RepID=A0A318JX48_9NOCA|nr:MFS transporter [Nocardia tenerifensis]PXX58145.1 MFS transporter [Nocardia tenerifensis]